MIKIVILGPESTGKSTLCKQLSAHYNTLWCPEYAREYLDNNGTAYSFPDLLTIAKGQLALEYKIEREVLQNNLQPGLAPSIPGQQEGRQLFFIDTDQQVMKVWCEYVFNDCHSWILRQIAERTCHLYLLCKPDLPWVQDALREYPNEKPRIELYHIYKDMMVNQPVTWADIAGTFENRLEMAINAVDQMMLAPKK